MSAPVVPSTGGRNVVESSPGTRGANSSITSSPHLVSQPQVKKIVQDIQGCLNDLKAEFEENRQPITDDNQILHRFCAKLEYLLQYGMKEKVTLLGRKKEYWDFFCDCLGSTKGVNDGIKYVKTIGDYKTSLGKGRAFLRFCLMHGRMPDSIQQCVMNGKITRVEHDHMECLLYGHLDLLQFFLSDWYQPKSIWLQHEERSNLISALYDLSDLQFDLAPRGYDLDNAWPSFAKKSLTGGVHSWTLSSRSRTSSMSSLTSIPGQQDLTPRYGLSSTPNDSADLDLLASESMHSDLLDKVEALEQQKKTFQHSVLEIQGELDKLRDQHRELNNTYLSQSSELKDLQQRYDRKCMEAETKEKEWTMKDGMYTKQLEHAQTEAQTLQVKVRTLEDKVTSLETSRKDSDETNMTRVADMEKVKGDLLLQVRTLQQDLDTSQSADSKKSDTIRALEDKMEALEQKNRDLLDKMEDMVTNKNQVATNSLDSASRLQEVVVSLKEAETENVSLQAANKELTSQCMNKEQEVEMLKGKLCELEDHLKLDREEFRQKLESVHQTLNEERAENQTLVARLQKENSSLVKERNSDELKFNNEIDTLQLEKGKIEKEYGILKETEENLLAKLQTRKEQLNTETKKFKEHLECEKEKKLDLENQIVQLKESVHKQDEINNENSKKVEELQSQCVKHERSYRDLDLVCQGLKSNIEGKDIEIQCLQEQHSLEKGSADEVKGALREKVEYIKELDTKERQLKQLLLWLQSSSEVCQFDNIPVQLSDENFKSVINGLIQNFQDKQKTVETSAVTIAQLKEKCQCLQQESSEKGKQLSQKHKDLDSLKMCLKTAQDSEGSLHKRCGELEELLEKSSSDQKSTVKALEETRSKLLEYSNDCEKFKSEISRLETNISQKTSEVIDLRDQVTKSEEKLRQNSDTFSKSKKQEQTLTEKIRSQEELVAKQTDVIGKLRDDFASSQKVVETLKKDIENLSSEKMKSENFRDKLKEKYKESLSTIDSLKEMVSVMTNEKKDLEIKTTELKTSLFDAEKMLAKVKSERETDALEHEKTLTRLQTERQNLTENLEEVLSDLGCIKDQLKDTSSELENAYTLKAKIESERDVMVTTKMELENQVQQIESKCHTLENELEQKGKTLVDFSNKCNSMETEKQELSAKMEETCLELESSQNRIAEITSQRQKDQESFELKEKDLKTKCQTYAQDIIALEEKIETLENDLATITHEKNDLGTNLTSLNSDLEDRQKKITEVTNVNLSLSATLQSLQTELSEKSERTDLLESNLRTKQEEFVLEKDAMKQELSALQFQISTEQIQQEEALQNFTSQENNISEMRDKLQEQEILIEQLEHEMSEIKAARGRESEHRQQEVNRLVSKCESKDEERKDLKDTLQQKIKELQDEKLLVLSLKAQLSEMKDSGKESKSEIELLKNDTVQLKKKLIKLTKEKDSLWQKSDRLAYEQKVLVKEKWMDDRHVLNCLGCNTEFSFTVRKHHCRLCGKIFCYSCSNQWIMTAHSSKKLRVCTSCYMWHSQIEAESITTPGGNDSEDELEKTTELPHRVYSRSSREISVDAPECSSSTVSISTEDSESLATEEDPLPYQVESHVTMVPGQVATDIKISLVGQNETDEIKQVKRNGTGEEAGAGEATKDEVFHLISDEEIARSLSISEDSQIGSSDPSLTTSLTVSTEELEKGQINSKNETWIKPGRKFAVPIIVDRVNTVLCWEFTSQPKDIVFSVLFQEDASSKISQAQILVPSCKCDSHKQAVKGELTAKQSGVYTLLFDNTYSRMTSKKICYTLWSK